MTRGIPFVGLVLLSLVTSAAQAGKFNEVLSAGDAAPDFGGLAGVDDKEHALADYADARLLVLVFTCNRCPVATAYQERLVVLQHDYRERGLQVVAFNVGRGAAETLNKMRDRGRAAGFSFPYLSDPKRGVAGRYGVTVTPQVFLLDQDRKVAYMGRIDDAQDESRVRHADLRQAVDALLAGRQPQVRETRPVGCPIEPE